jgi:hypothetical protein
VSDRCAGQASASASIPTSLTNRVLRTCGEGRGVARVRAIPSRRAEVSTSPDSIATQLQTDQASSVDRRVGARSPCASRRESRPRYAFQRARGRADGTFLNDYLAPDAAGARRPRLRSAAPASASTAKPARKAKRTPQKAGGNAQRKHWSFEPSCLTETLIPVKPARSLLACRSCKCDGC